MKPEDVKALQQENEILKKKLAAFSVDTIKVRSFIALRRYVDEHNKLLMKLKVVVVDKRDRDDALSERARKFADEQSEYIKQLEVYERSITSEVLVAEEKQYGSLLEEELDNGD